MLREFEDILTQYEPMISACMRKLNIYKNHELYKQSGRIALWRAWMKFDEQKGNFPPYAYRSIYGAMLDELKKEVHREEYIDPVEDEKLAVIIEQSFTTSFIHEELGDVIDKLSRTEQDLLLWIFVEGISLSQAADRAGITISGIKKRRERLLNKLRERLA
ncbi:sigma-70 family RNA polymerase sigma factor [Bacillus sp. FJAT-22090]|uniref:sigma-70 family RNA polymerase sigma factor n=1 Tax=Bacillus sp. FJAT-22090 TaxID=1581038 RepID=UPI0021B43E72|nr:sigma-70 family RNA polymerase sigma factor [Bacillus sp. FJAT-22090]